ncbi:MAG: DNA endonuclease SmrA [Pseudomonadales bacterium]
MPAEKRPQAVTNVVETDVVATDGVNDEESFRAAMAGVAPLQQKTVDPLNGPAPVTSAQLERREAALGLRKPRVDPNYLTLGEVPLLHPRDMLSWKKDGVQHEVFRKLRGGKYPIDGQLDLHRHTVKEARAALYAFMGRALERGWRTVLISHGRGELGPTPARIKSYVAFWLGQVPEVIAFHSADRQHGGTGSVYALLKKTSEARETTRERHGQKGDATAAPLAPEPLSDSERR